MGALKATLWTALASVLADKEIGAGCRALLLDSLSLGARERKLVGVKLLNTILVNTESSVVLWVTLTSNCRAALACCAGCEVGPTGICGAGSLYLAIGGSHQGRQREDCCLCKHNSSQKLN